MDVCQGESKICQKKKRGKEGRLLMQLTDLNLRIKMFLLISWAGDVT